VASSGDGATDPRTAGMTEFARRRKLDSRRRLLAAASARFRDSGYDSVSVEDITATAGMSRVTFYRHFTDKAALAADLFRQAAEDALPGFLQIGSLDYRDRAVVAGWIGERFAVDRDHQALLSIFAKAMVNEPGFTARAQHFIQEVIDGLGARIPAFAVDRDASRRRWLEAWLLIYEILDQSNHAAFDSGVGGDPLVIDILADRFVRFVEG
jgi:AcrR family transcriptional regulator